MCFFYILCSAMHSRSEKNGVLPLSWLNMNQATVAFPWMHFSLIKSPSLTIPNFYYIWFFFRHALGLRTTLFFLSLSLSEQASDVKKPNRRGWVRAVRSRPTSRQVAPRRLSLSKVSSERLISSKRDSESSRHRGQTPGIVVRAEMDKERAKSTARRGVGLWTVSARDD